MGKLAATAILGGWLALFAGCGSNDRLIVESGDEAGTPDPRGAPIASSSSVDGGAKNHRTEVHDAGTSVDAAIDDAGSDASDSPDAAPPIDPVDAGDSGSSLPSMFELPGRLVKDSVSECWSGPNITPYECKPVPVTDPPILKPNDQCVGDAYKPSVLVRVPPHTCAKFTVRYSHSCMLASAKLPVSCSKSTNTTDQDMWVPVFYETVSVRWEHESACPFVTCD